MADKQVFEQSLADETSEFQFEEKKFLTVNDSQNGGTYPTGQVTFDLAQFASADWWANFPEGVLTLPLVMVLSGSAGGKFTADAQNVFCMSLKNGYHQLIHNISIQINGKTYKSMCNFENMDINYRILSQFSTADVQNFGDSIGFAKDGNNFTYGVAGSSGTGIGETNNVIKQALTVPTGGYQVTNQFNAGRWQRMQNTSFDPVITTNMANLIKDASKMGTDGKNYAITTTSGVGVAGSLGVDEVVYYIMATLPLRLISPLFASLPMVKGARVTLQIQTNTSCSVTCNTKTGGLLWDSVAPVVQSQGTIPFMISPPALSGTGGFNCITTATAFKATIGIGKSYQALNNYTHPSQINCRIQVPMYKMSPAYEEAYLVRTGSKKQVVFNDLYNAIFPANPATQGFQLTMPMLVSKPRYLLIYPFIGALNNGASPPSGTSGGIVIGSPINSPFSTAPATCSPYISISNFNVSVGGKFVYQINTNYNYEKFLFENRPSGAINGGLTNGLSSGLISEYDFYNGYGMIYVDLSRHSLASDAVQQNIVITGTNNSLVPIDLYCFVGYEKAFDLNVANGQIENCINC